MPACDFPTPEQITAAADRIVEIEKRRKRRELKLRLVEAALVGASALPRAEVERKVGAFVPAGSLGLEKARMALDVADAAFALLVERGDV